MSVSTRREFGDITQPINEMGDEIDSILNENEEERYFYGIIMLYSFIGYLLKWLVFVKLLWDKSTRELPEDEIKAVQLYCAGLSFYNAQQIALSVDVIDWDLYKEVDKVRLQRNDLVHQLWLYEHRANYSVLREALEKLAGVASELVESLNRLTEEIGVDDAYEIVL